MTRVKWMIFLNPKILANILKPLYVRFGIFFVGILDHLPGEFHGKFNIGLPLGSDDVSVDDHLRFRQDRISKVRIMPITGFHAITITYAVWPAQ